MSVATLKTLKLKESYGGVEVGIRFDKNGKVKGVYMQEGDANFFVYDEEHIDKKIYLETYNRIIPH